MKRIGMTVLLVIALASLLGLSAVAVAADGGSTNTTPASAVYFDNQSHPIAANSSLWYIFYYALSPSGATQNTTITLVSGAANNLAIDVWTPDNAINLSASQPFGHGAGTMYRCEGHWCHGADLTWSGWPGATGIYYVRVSNYNSFDTTEQLTIQGDGIAPALPATPVPVTASAASSNGMDDPYKAVALDGTPQTVPANSAKWFSFYYLTDYIKPPFVTIRLQYGAVNGLDFELYAPERLADWWDNPPTGHGTVEMVSCPTGQCATLDKTSGGAFGSTGTYYVRVLNHNSTDIPAVLTTTWR